MNKEIWHVHLAGGQKVKWALDEDLRWIRQALGAQARFTILPSARIVHAAWWPVLLETGRDALEGKTVLSFADNPPAFYLTQPGFTEAAGLVDLWIARSREALAQFQSLGLRAELAPYCVDPAVFQPIQNIVRRDYDIPDEAFVIGNFHRDSEGSDLTKPKAQKGADIFLEIAREFNRRDPRLFVLLAGPRRHWLRDQLTRAKIPFRFAGKPEIGDDYSVNILDRPTLNRLYQLLDVCVVSSRWEGGPYSILESLFAGRPVISTPVGIARDALPAECLYRTVTEAADLLESHARSHALETPAAAAREQVLRENSVHTLQKRLTSIYAQLPKGGVPVASAVRSAGLMAIHRLSRETPGPVQNLHNFLTNGMLPEETPFMADREAVLRSAAGIAQARK